MLKVLHVINSLMLGGAETLLVNSLSKGGLQQSTENYVVYFQGVSNLEKRIDPDVKVICLNYKGIFDLPRTLLQLRKIVKQYKIDIVHSHLNPAGFYTRLALPRKIKQVHTLHTTYSLDTTTRKFLLQLERNLLFNNKNVSLIFLSEALKSDFFDHVNFKGKAFVLNNFVEDAFFTSSKKMRNENFKIIAVGNLNPQKNYLYLYEVFRFLKNIPVSLDIYGGGDIEKHKAVINPEGLNINFMGQQNEIYKILPQYDLFIMASTLEGFPISVLEAMASGVPCMLSDIGPLKNLAADNAIYFSLNNAEAVAKIIKSILNNEIDMEALAAKAKAYAEKARRELYIKKLLNIYTEIINNRFGNCNVCLSI